MEHIRLRNKGVTLPITCPMCNADIEHLLRLFFDCPSASSCWHAVNLDYDVKEVQSVPHWVLSKLELASHEEVISICVVLWGIWYWRNKKVRNNQMINPTTIAMENSFNLLKDWKPAS